MHLGMSHHVPTSLRQRSREVGEISVAVMGIDFPAQTTCSKRVLPVSFSLRVSKTAQGGPLPELGAALHILTVCRWGSGDHAATTSLTVE